MTTPTIRKVSNVGGLSNNNNNLVDSPTTNTSPPIRPVSRVVRVLSSSKQVANNTSTDNNNNNASTSTVDQQQQQQTPSTTTTTTDNNTSEAPKKKVIVRVVKRTVGTSGATSEATTTTNNVPSLANTPSNDNNNTNDNNESNNNSSGTITINNNNNNISSNNNLQSSTIKNEVSTPSSTPSNDEVSTSTNTTTTNPTTTTPRTTKIADRWLQRTQTNAPTTVTTTTTTAATPVTSTASVSTPTTTTAATPTTTTEPTTPKRRVRSITNREEKPTDASSTTTTATTTNSTPSVINGSTITTESTNINSTNPQFGAKLASAANRDLKSNSTIVAPSTQTPVVVSPHQTSKSMNDIPQNSIKDKINKLNPSLKLLTPEQLMMDKKADRGSDNIRPLRPLEIATWYGGSVSVATEDPMFDSSSIDDLKKEAPDVYYSNFLFNPLFDEQSACDTPTITMSSQEILIYNFVVELMRKKYSNLLALDPIAFEEEMKNASSLPSLTLKNISSSHTRTDSVTSSTEDVLTGEDIGYPINKCSKNWKYQLKKKRENTKSAYNPTDGMFTPRASVQLQTSSPSSPATANSAAVNPLFDHLYYMPCWKHQIQLETIVKRSGEQRKVQ